MKKSMSIFDGWALALVVIFFQRPGIFPWWFICLPWILEMILKIAAIVLNETGVTERIILWYYRRIIRLKAWIMKRRILREARNK